MTCPTPTLGTLTNLSGAFGGIQASALVDAYHNKDQAQYSWQWTTKLTNKPDGCAHYQRRERRPNEVWLFPTLIGGKDIPGDTTYCPPPTTPLQLAASGASGSEIHDGNGNLYVASVKFVTFSSGCREGKPVTAAGGTITFTNLVEPYTWDAANPYQISGETGNGLVEATLEDVTFPNGQSVSGSFVAPFCSAAGCPAPPTSWQCVA